MCGNCLPPLTQVWLQKYRAPSQTTETGGADLPLLETDAFDCDVLPAALFPRAPRNTPICWATVARCDARYYKRAKTEYTSRPGCAAVNEGLGPICPKAVG